MCKRQYKLIAFDFDGVLADSMQFNMQIINAVCHTAGAVREVNIEDLQNIDNMAFEDVAKLIGVAKENVKSCVNSIKEQILNNYDALELFPGIEASLKLLSQFSLQLIIVTHNSEDIVNAFLEKYQLTSYFTKVIGTETAGSKAIKLTTAAKQLDILPEQSLMIGDSIGDITSAIAANVIPVGVAWGFQKADKLISAGAVKVLQSPEEILKFVK